MTIDEGKIAKLNLQESLVVRFAPDLKSATVVIVLESAFHSLRKSEQQRSADPSALVHRLLFAGVADYRKTDGSKKFMHADSFFLQDEPAPILVYDIVDAERERCLRHFSGHFSNFGFVEFDYSNVSISDKLILPKARMSDGSWSYLDAETDAALDRYNPFDD